MNHRLVSKRNEVWRCLFVVIIANFPLCDTSEPVPDYRLKQCLTYRKLPLDGRIPDWVPYHESTDPCSLRCRDARLRASVVIEAKVPDGTFCRNDTETDVCINGTCLSVGCDGQLGSGHVVDRCGVCGGDGSSCRLTASASEAENTTSSVSDSALEWHQTNFSECSVSCGVGVQTSQVICREKKTLRVTDEKKCNSKTKPERRRKTCRLVCSHHVWIAGIWSDCTRSCGVGVAHRTALCAAALPDGSFERISNHMCDDTKPELIRVCGLVECPQWITGQWSPCSKTCSIGIQQRVVVCRRPSSNHDCSPDDKPATQKPCHSGISCNRTRELGWRLVEGGAALMPPSRPDELRGRADYELSDFGRDFRGLTDSDEDVKDTNIGLETAEGRNSRFKATASSSRAWPSQNMRNWTRRPFQRHQTKVLPKSTIEFAPTPSVSVHVEQDLVFGSGDTDRPTDYVQEHLELNSGSVGDNREVSTTPSFVVSSWSQCSAVCGTGVRTRRVQCQVFHEVSRTVHDLPDSSCTGQKPADSEYCSLRDCLEQARQESYAWMLTGHGPCSRSCAGGTQEASFTCLRVSDRVLVKNDRCQHLPTPYKPPQPCNERRCPPRWRAFPHGPCSASCGGGHQLRVIRCIYDLPNGDLEEVSDDRCSQPKPPRVNLCNMAPCAPSWNVDSWSKCSVTCGSGIQTRPVRCEQKISLATVATVNESFCAEYSAPPQTRQPCDMGHCPNTTVKQSPIIYGENSSFVQLKPFPTRVILIVGGSAVLIPGTTVLIYCPVRNFNKSLITWTHGEREIARKGRVKVSPKGILRIRNSRQIDAGLYTCTAGRDSANVTVSFHSLLTAYHLQQTKLPYLERSLTRTDNESLSDDEEEQKFPYAFRNLLRNNTLQDLVALQFYPHPWSACSKTCGGSGLQSRDIACEITVQRGYTLIVDEKFCVNKGLTKPIETRDCGFESSALTCPSWETGPWAECTDESCFRPGFGSRKRPTYCVAYNRSQVDLGHCPKEFKPIDKEECQHENCQVMLKVSNWTKCSVSCGGRGMKTRLVDCVWTSNGQPAGTECDLMPKPETVKPCFMPSCIEPECRDESKYCSLIPKLHMCRYPQYRRECCFSCNPSSSSNQPQAQALRSRQAYVV